MGRFRGRSLFIFVAVLVLFVAGASGCWFEPDAADRFEGWIEGHFIFVSPEEPGRIVSLSVREGDKIETGTKLFRLDDELQLDAVAEAEAELVNAKVTFNRAEDLYRKKVGTEKTLDDAKAALRAAEARLNSAKTRLARRAVDSPVAGVVQEVYFRVGEMVQSARPVVSILPPKDTRARFFVPQEVVPKLGIGQKVLISCDGCESDLTGTISFISAEAEFTPPIIYSPKERSRLVFRIEARPEQPGKLRVGQPVSVAPVSEGDRADGQR